MTKEWKWRTRDYSDDSMTELLEERWAEEIHTLTSGTEVLWVGDDAPGMVNKSERNWDRSDTGKRLYRVRELVRVS
ncbi:MAG: hypothetical protein D1H97_16455 [Paracoccus sp. BP8]|nr:MAG: hypothetical protein D1H97_16455 [Paracoccus sp. BP8]